MALRIRRFQPGDEPALLAVHRSAIAQIARHDYTPEQIAAWLPRQDEQAGWMARVRRYEPFVAVLGDEVVGYTDLQSNGYINHFFVSGPHPRMGIGSGLMQHLLNTARAMQLTAVTADVSRTAQPLFERFGFEVVEQCFPVRRGVVMANAFMRCRLSR